MNDFLPVCEPLLAGNELKYVTDAVASGWISSSVHTFRLLSRLLQTIVAYGTA